MEPPKEEEKIQNIEEERSESEEEEELTGKNKNYLNEKLIGSVKKNQYEEVEKCLKKKAQINFEQNTKKKWNSIIWASCLGYYKIAKLLITKGALQNYLQLKPQNHQVTLGSNKQMKPNPLHWACFKGNLQIFYILLKNGVHWEDVDSCGNNSVMLSAAGNSVPIFEAFLQYGVSLGCYNTRGHTVKDLTTNQHILKLADKYLKAKQCVVSKIIFKEKQIKHWCWVCKQFANSDNFKIEWVLSDLKATEKEKIDGRCTVCWQKAKVMQNELQEAIDIYEEIGLYKKIEEFKERKDEIEITFLKKCEEIKHKLSIQNQILAYLKSLSKVDNYKIILKSVNKIHKLLKDAEPINIDQNVIEKAHQEIERLNSQRNLRYQVDNIDTSVATRSGVAKLQEVYTAATQKSVSNQYLDVANQIKTKMNKSIEAQDIYQEFVNYPQRPDPYPDPLVIDFKTKKPLDPETKKPTDPANLLPKKKKGKKPPPFVIPDWAIELQDMNNKIANEEQLLSMKQELGLSEEFVGRAHEMVVLMKKESRYRKDMNTLQAMVDDATKKKK